MADDMPDEDTHPFFPDHFWPYPIIAVVMLVTVGLLAFYVQKDLQLESPADPRTDTGGASSARGPAPTDGAGGARH
jgi:hypothetical protein